MLDEKTAKYCAELAAIKPDKKGVVTLTKEQLAFQSKVDCPVERPADCPDEAKQEKLDKTVKEYVRDRQRRQGPVARVAQAVLPAGVLARQAEQDRAEAREAVRPQRHRQRQAPALIMIKTALSASLIALAVLAPAASAADEVKPPRQTDQAAPTCRTPAPAVVDPKAPPAPRLTKFELEALAKLPLCSTEEPVETCLMVDRAVYDKADVDSQHQRGRAAGVGPELRRVHAPAARRPVRRRRLIRWRA